jgi:sterol desaturase/sphingolipid hydroxylase (fatty acid hydroxylase superfamily)
LASWRVAAAWLAFPVLMGGFLALAGWGFSRGYDTATWVSALTVANFFTLVAIEQVLPRKRQANLLRDRQSLNDVGHGVLFTFLGRPLAGAISLGSVALAAKAASSLGFAGALPSLWPAASPFGVQLALGLAFWTLADYWVHRSLHTFERLWWFHSIHHDTPQMHVLKSGRLHIGEEIFNFVLKPIPLLLLGVPGEVLVWVGLWTIFDGNLVHSNVDQRFPGWAHYFLPTVHLHYIHHAADRRLQDSNYSGSTPIWDILFGTFNHPDRNPVGELGIHQSPVPPGFVAQLLAPFRWQAAPPSATSPRSIRTPVPGSGTA